MSFLTDFTPEVSRASVSARCASAGLLAKPESCTTPSEDDLIPLPCRRVGDELGFHLGDDRGVRRCGAALLSPRFEQPAASAVPRMTAARRLRFFIWGSFRVWMDAGGDPDKGRPPHCSQHRKRARAALSEHAAPVPSRIRFSRGIHPTAPGRPGRTRGRAARRRCGIARVATMVGRNFPEPPVSEARMRTQTAHALARPRFGHPAAAIDGRRHGAHHQRETVGQRSTAPSTLPAELRRAGEKIKPAWKRAGESLERAGQQVKPS